MNIKTSLTFKFTAIVAGILLAFSLFTYQFSEIFREDEFTHRLKNVSKNVVVNYLDKEELSTDILKLLYEKQLNRFPQERLIIADENYEVIFASQKTKEIETSKSLIVKNQNNLPVLEQELIEIKNRIKKIGE